MRLGPAHHALAPPVLDQAFLGFHARAVEAVKRTGRQVAEELRAVEGGLFLQPVEHRLGQAARIGRGLHHDRRHRGDDAALGDAARGLAVAGDIGDHFAAAGGMTDMHGVLEIQMGGQRRQVGSIMVHVMTAIGLGRAAMAAPVMGDDPIALAAEEHELRIPVIRRQRPAMAEDDGLFAAAFGSPILVENLGAILGDDEGHGGTPLEEGESLPSQCDSFCCTASSADFRAGW